MKDKIWKYSSLITFAILVVVIVKRFALNSVPSEDYEDKVVEPVAVKNAVLKKRIVENRIAPQKKMSRKKRMPIIEKLKKVATSAPGPQYMKVSDDYVHTDSDGNILITQVIIVGDGKFPVVHGDIIYKSMGYIKSLEGKGNAVLGKPVLWRKGEIPYEIDSKLPNPRRVTDAISVFNIKTVIKFRQRKKNEKDYILFRAGEGHCYSNLGRQGGKQMISLSEHCYSKHIYHEMMHTVGFMHEQNREDRDEHVTIYWENIEEHFHPQFKKIPHKFMHGIDGTKFDLKSIMLYPSTAFAADPDDYSMTLIEGDPIPLQNGELSISDVIRIKALYKDEIDAR